MPVELDGSNKASWGGEIRVSICIVAVKEFEIGRSIAGRLEYIFYIFKDGWFNVRLADTLVVTNILQIGTLSQSVCSI